MTFEQSACVLQVLLSIGLGGGDALVGFVEDGDDPALFAVLGEMKRNLLELAAGQFLESCACT